MLDAIRTLNPSSQLDRRAAGLVWCGGPDFWSTRGAIAMSKTLPISEVKARLPELVTGVEEREEEIVVTRKGKPAAVLVNYGEYERLKETIEILGDADLMRQIRRSRRFYGAGGTGLSLEQVFDGPSRPPKKRAR